MKDLTIVSIKGSAYFAKLIAKQLSNTVGSHVEMLDVERKRFDGGERYFRFASEDRMVLFGKNVLVVASIVSDDDLNEVYRLGSAIAKSGARRIIYVIPFEAYTTMERAVKPNEIVSAKIITRQLSQLPQGDLRNCFLFLDLHTAGFVHYFEGECLRFELYSDAVLSEAIARLGLTNFMFGSADLGRPKWVRAFAKKFKTRMALVDKSRDFQTTKVEQVIGDVAGMNVIIYDDMTRSAKTLVGSGNAYLAEGARSVHAVISHLALDSEEVIDFLLNSSLVKVITTNSHPMSHHPKVRESKKFEVVGVEELFADAIWRLQQ